MIQNNRKEQIIKETQKLIQTIGFKEFSISQVAENLNLHRSSILYYFKDSEELLKEALKRYRIDFLEELNKIKNENNSLREKLDKYIKIHEEVLLNKNKICLCAALGSDFPSLPESIKNQILIHIEENEGFIFEITSNVLTEKNLKDKSIFFVESLQGIMINCRNKNNIERYYISTNLLIETVFKI